jgi:amino acid transporter
MLDYVLIPSVAYLFSGIALHALVPAVPAWAFTAAAFALTTALNFAGVRVAARAGFVVLVAELIVLALFLLAGAVVLGQSGGARSWLSPLTGVDGISADVLMRAVSVAVLSYLGFDAIASFAEESDGDARQVGQAIGWCLGAAGVAFIAQTWMAAVLSPIAPAALAAAPATQGVAFYDVTRAAIGGWLATVVAVTKAIGPMFAAMTGQAAAARLLYGMAREGRLPGRLATVDATAGVPRAALAATAVLTVSVSVWAARRPDGLSLLVSIVDVGALSAFLMLHVSVVGYFVVRRLALARPWHLAVPAAGIATCAWVLIAASPLAQLVATVWAAIGVGVWVASRRPHDTRAGG